MLCFPGFPCHTLPLRQGQSLCCKCLYNAEHSSDAEYPTVIPQFCPRSAGSDPGAGAASEDHTGCVFQWGPCCFGSLLPGLSLLREPVQARKGLTLLLCSPLPLLCFEDLPVRNPSPDTAGEELAVSKALSAQGTSLFIPTNYRLLPAF